jgi:glycosyltransferase involved in cell wall biosynthesis
LGKKENIVNFLRSSDIFILPSLAEGLSNALLEAMACGLPVVATNIGGTNEVIKNGVNGILVEPKNSEQLAQAILSLMKNQKYAYRLGINARKTITEKYSLDLLSEKYVHLYCKLLKEK